LGLLKVLIVLCGMCIEQYCGEYEHE